MSDPKANDDSTDSENNNKITGDFRKNIMNIYVKEIGNCMERHIVCEKENAQSGTNEELADEKDADDDDVTKRVPDSETRVRGDVSDEDSGNVRNVADRGAADVNDSQCRSPVRVSTTSFSVSDILDPKKFTGCNGTSKGIQNVHTQPWLPRKRRRDEDSESEEDRMEENG